MLPAEYSRLIGLADNARGFDAAILDMRLRLPGGFDRDILDRQRAARQVERHLAVTGLAAVGAKTVEGRLDFGSGAMLDSEIEAEPLSLRRAWPPRSGRSGFVSLL